LRAVVFDLSIPKYLAAKALGKQLPALYYGRPSCLQFREVAEPALPSSEWVKLKVLGCGLCGSDLATVLFKFSPSLSPFSSFPCVLGHEILGVIVEAGRDARGLREGDRVAVNPALGCPVLGEPPCPACARGLWGSCHRAGSQRQNGHFDAGLSLGYHRQLPGGFTERVVAHRLQLHRVSDGVPDRRAVLSEPLAIAMHAVLKRPPAPGERVLIIGGGMIAYAVLWALRKRGFANEVTQLCLIDYQGELGKKLGANHVWKSSGDALLGDTVRTLGATRHKAVIGPDVLTGGFDLTYDCIGSLESLRDALSVTASQGALVLLGGAGVLPKLDWSAVWSKEIAIVGSSWYGPEASAGGRHTFELVQERLSDSPELDAIVTHTFALEQASEAMLANIDRARFRSVKTIFQP
jgi:threonine dehydrogenase-like Zn-dependent dehydrogenase